MNVIEALFYVYEHWRPDTGACFYVGKGHDDRAYKFRRNKYHKHIVKKLARAGLKPDVHIVKSGLDESAALALEVERIAYWKAQGVTLANITNGGEGVCGLKHSEETRVKIRAKRAQQKIVCSEETREKISRAQRGIPKPMERRLAQSRTMTGRKMPEVTRAALRAANAGSKRTAEARARMSAAQRGHATSDQARANMRAAHLGKLLPAETRRKMSESQRARWACRRLMGRAQ